MLIKNSNKNFLLNIFAEDGEEEEDGDDA
jgi:hypothetical protein